MFSSIVTSFTDDNISAFGSLAIMAILYMFIGGVIAWMISEVFYVPQDFRWGIIVVSVKSFGGSKGGATIRHQPVGTQDSSAYGRWESHQTGVTFLSP